MRYVRLVLSLAFFGAIALLGVWLYGNRQNTPQPVTKSENRIPKLTKLVAEISAR